MERFLERIYLVQVLEDCRMCLASVSAFNAALNDPRNDEPFTHAMSFIHKAAAVSRIFWPPKSFSKESSARAKSRGENLKKALQINDTHPIKSRDLRDHLEHFDERLDDWAEHSKNRCIIVRMIGKRSHIAGNSINDSDIIHLFDPDTHRYYFRGQEFNLQELVDGIVDIHNRTGARILELDRP